MTDEERQKLCAKLRSGAANRLELEAADEIEQLIEQLKTSQERIRELEAELDDYL
jgi:hypothetical protein